ncbi:MAG: transcriptional repressor LexA [Ruminococcus sp.]|nr:transcriptional repressor LexA [Ruminococcus sp.]
MKALSKSQQKILDYLKSCSREGRVPSVREICDNVGLSSTSTVHHHLNSLEEKGLIVREHGVNRCIQIAGEEKSAGVPVLGRVAAGNPIVANEDIECYVPVPEQMTRGRELFALRVQGESMINAGILNNDIVIVNRTPVAENGEIVVALVEDSATVKRFYKEDGHFRLQPENDSFEPIIVDEVVLLGKVISLVRNYE